MSIRKIKLVLHHDYLAIEDSDTKENIDVPIRCAKLIHNMYSIRNAKNEQKDIKHYSACDYQNAEYNISVMLMNTEFDNELQWVSHIIKPFNFNKE